jgi:trans-aconitate methyltransferase
MTDCKRYYLGCTCGQCHERYIKRYAHACTYGVDPRLDELEDATDSYLAKVMCCKQGCSRCKRT